MSVRLSIWRAERVAADHFALYRVNRYMGYVLRFSNGEWQSYGLGNRKGSRIGRPTAAAAARFYFGADAAGAIEFAKEAKP